MTASSDRQPAGEAGPQDPLGVFHPLIRGWFLSSVGTPTEVQAGAWPVIARGGHALISAPTGTGKTLAAFLWGINQLASGALAGGKVRILYVSPLKALNNDIQRNLLAPLAALETAFREAGEPFPRIRVLTRSGDTPPGDRRRMLRSPPEILITTPESLNLILSSPNARLMLGGVAAVILDEIHAVAGSKRGTHLVTAVDRLVRLAGDFQRIALSATVKPLSAVADLVGGYVMARPAGAEPVYRKRPVEIVHRPMAKVYELRIEYPPAQTSTQPAVAAPPSDEPVFDAIARECRRIIGEHRSTLFFVNSRRHAEKLARFINEGQPEPLAWSHHGSLSRELRLVVERRLKAGELKAIVATSSLELGIDIGTLDRVILVQTPFTVASAVQRLGRAGHRVNEPSRGVLFPLHGRDIVDAAVVARCVREQDIDELAPVVCPLDVLAQVVVSMTFVETWNAGELYDEIRTSFPFHDLPRRQFDLVLEMLAGRYEETRLRDLTAMISWDRQDGTLRAKTGAWLRLAMGGGTIPDRGYFSMRTADSKALVGELDEEFVWERSLGDTFVFGTQGWRIQKIDHQNVEVVPAQARIGMSPFWKAEERNRGFHLSERISGALEDWNPHLEDARRQAALETSLEASHGLAPSAARTMVDFLARQREASGADLPHRHHLLVEHTRDPDGKGEGATVVLHTLWGGAVNRPFGLALSAAWEERFGFRPEMIQTNDAVLLLLPQEASAEEIVSLVDSSQLQRLLRSRLEGSGFFGARFREAAGRALLLPRASARKRTPLWLTRQRAKSLFAAVSRFDDFPLLVEAWRTCLRDEFDLPNLVMVLDELRSGAIKVSEVTTPVPSPFCGELVWKQTNTLMYLDDTPPGQASTNLRPDLVRELALSADVRPRLDPAQAAEFQAKLQRTAPGYAPRDPRELLDWVKERVLLPAEEWAALLDAATRDSGSSRESLLAPLAGKIEEIQLGGERCWAASETLPRIRRATAEGDEETLEGIVSEWLRSYGPVEPSFISRAFGLSGDLLDGMLEDLASDEAVVLDRLLQGSDALLVCDRENLETLLRISRARAREQAAVRTQPIERLPLLAARRHGILDRGTSAEDMKPAWETLFGCAVPAHLWEEEIFPARLEGFTTRWTDALFAEAGLLWLGCGPRRLTFCFPQDVELYRDRAESPDAAAFLPGSSGRYSFWDIVDHARKAAGGPRDSSDVAARLWELAWKGLVTCDSFAPVRRGLATGFRAEEPAREGTRRTRFTRWQAQRPGAGFWYPVPAARGERDALDEEELARDRVRQVLRRHGVVFRELLENELPALRWARLFRSLRTMEFSGEVVAGRFFDGVSGLQFALPSAVEELASEAAGPDDAVWWINAADPASHCGVDVPRLKAVLPSRISSTHVVFHGSAVVLVSRRRGRELELRVPADAPRLADYLGFVKVLTGRDARPLSAVHVQSINGEPAPSSPYKPRLLEAGFVEDFRRLTYAARP